MQQSTSWQSHQEKQPLQTVLIIDDEGNIIEVVRLGLRYEGFQVESASDGEQGITAAQRINPDLIILDLGLPAGDGYVVLDRLQRDDRLCNIPVVVLTARDPQSSELRAVRSGRRHSFKSQPTILNCWP